MPASTPKAQASRRRAGPLPIPLARATRTWVRGPASITPDVRAALVERLERHARGAEWSKHCQRVIVRTRGEFAYVDAAPVGGAGHILHLCRLRWTGDPARWEFAFFRCSTESYALCLGPNSDFHVTPEQAFDVGARYLLSP